MPLVKNLVAFQILNSSSKLLLWYFSNVSPDVVVGLILAFVCFVILCRVDAASDTLCSHLVSLIPLQLFVFLGLSLNERLPVVELGFDLLLSCGLSLHPRVCEDLFEAQPLRRVKRHHLLKELLELRREDIVAILRIDMRLPECFWFPSRKQAIELVLWDCTFERRSMS